MALDPRVLAALTAGAKTSSSYEPLVYGGGQEQQGAWNLGQGIIDVLSTGAYASAGLTNKIGRNLAAIGRGEVGAIADLVNPFSGIDAITRGVSDRRTFSDNLIEMGVSREAAIPLGLALDIGLDPTTYITGGAIAGVRGAAQGAKIAGQATKAGKVASKTAAAADPFVAVNRALTPDEKLGNLLSGIQRGYQTGKNQYKLSIKGNKLEKISAKKRKKAQEVRDYVEIGGTFSKLPTGSDAISAVEKLTAKEAKATQQFAKAKAKVDASALPGVTAGITKATAAKIASDAGRVIGTAEKAGDKFNAVVRSPEGTVLNHRFAKKAYATEANALKAAERAAREIEESLKGGADLNVQQSTAAATANDDVVRTALAPEEGKAADIQAKQDLTELSRKNALLNDLAKNIARPGAFLKPRKLDEDLLAAFDEAKEDFLIRFEDFKEAQVGASANKVSKVTVQDLNKYINAPAQTAKANPVFDQILEAPAVIPDNFTALRSALAANRVNPDSAVIDDLVFIATDRTASPQVVEQAVQAFNLSKNGLEEVLAADVSLKPWIDGIVTPNDAEDAIRELIEFIYKDLDPNSKQYKAILKTVSDAFAGKLKSVSGGMDEALTSDEVEEVFEAFFAGSNIPDALNKVGAIDLARLRDETYNGIKELTDDLQAGKLKLSETAKRDLANILGVPPNIITATLVKMTNTVNGLGRLIDDEAVQLGKGALTSSDAITATGNMSGPEVAKLAEPALDINRVDEITNQAADVNAPLPDTAVSDEAAAALLRFREENAAEFQAVLEKFPKDSNEVKVTIAAIFRNKLLPKIREQITELGARRNMSFEEIIDEAISGNLRFISEDPNSLTFGGALKLDELGSHGRLDVATEVVTRFKPLYRSSDAKNLAEREARYFYAFEVLLRSFGIPVRSTESAAMAARRENVKPGSKKAKNVKRQYSSVTYADIANLAVSQNRQDLIFELRKFRPAKSAGAGTGYGNFLPNAIEATWLTVKRFKESGADFARGTENYEELLFALNNIERKGGGFELAPQAKHVERTPAAAGEVARVSDDLIKFLDENYEALKATDDSREALLGAANGQAVFSSIANLTARMIRFNAQYGNVKQAFKAGNLTEAQLDDSVGKLLFDYDDMFKQIETGNFTDRNLAINTASMYKSMFLDGYIEPTTGSRRYLTSFAQQLTNTLAEIRATDAAFTTARAAGKSTEVAERAGKSARTTQKGKNLEQDIEITAEQYARANNAGVPTAAASEALDTATQETVSLNNAFAKLQTHWTKAGMALSGNYGMGALFKTILSSSEQQAISYSHLFSLGLKAIQRASRGRETELNDAFKALQAYRQAVNFADELGDVAPTVDEFLAGYGAVNREFFTLLDQSFEMLVGSKGVFGAAKSLSIMKSELNDGLRQFGLASIKVGDSTTLDNFWLNYKPEEFPERSPLEFLNLLNLAVHRAASRVEIASQFDIFVAKTPKQIADAGDSLADYVKIDTDTGIGQLLGETGKLVHRDDAEKLKYVQNYLNYDSVLSEGALSRIVEISDRVTYVLKSTNTLLRPGHHVTSIVGEAAMNLLAGVRISSYNNTARILNKFRPGQYENAGEPFKAYAELTAVKGKRIKADEFDSVYWIRPDGKKEILPDEIVYQLAERWGVLVHPGGSLEDFIVAGDAVFKGAYAGFHKAMNKISVFASHRDNFFRLTHFIDELQKTSGAKNLEEAALSAATAIREWHPTAGSLSAFEKKYARRVVYFYTWQRVALTKIVATMIEKPGIVTIPSKIQYAFADANGMNPESFGDPWDPDGIYASWHTGQLWGPQFQGPAGEGDSWGLQPAIQPLDILGQMFKPFTLQPGQDPLTSMAQGAGDLMGQNLNPIIKTLIESTAQSRLGEGGDLPGAPEYLLNQIGVVNTLSKLTGIGQDPNPYTTPEEVRENNARLLTNLLLGQRLTDYSTPASQYKWTIDQQELMRRMAE